MSLQDSHMINAFCFSCKDLWVTWKTDTRMNRESKIKKAIVYVANFMRESDISFPNLSGDYGAFCWGDWELEIDNTFTKKNNITKKEFVELCCTAYHETRHAEQFFLIAQGLAIGKLSFPDKSKAQIIQDAQKTGHFSSVRSKVSLFEGSAMGTSKQSKRQMIASWLNIPHRISGMAETTKIGFNQYIQKAKPQWFRRRTVLLEVEEWMRSTYKRTLGGINRWAQSDHGPYKIYRDLPEEHDAHEIEKRIKTVLLAKINASANVTPKKKKGFWSFLKL